MGRSLKRFTAPHITRRTAGDPVPLALAVVHPELVRQSLGEYRSEEAMREKFLGGLTCTKRHPSTLVDCGATALDDDYQRLTGLCQPDATAVTGV